MAGWTTPFRLLLEETIQRRDEGCRIPEAWRGRFDALDPERQAWDTAAIEPLYDELMALPADPGLAAAEPNNLTDIRALRPEGRRDLAWAPGEDQLLDRLHGAWLGRASGCALGKPVEGMGMSAREGQPVGRQRIKAYLQARDDWPLQDYFSGRDVGDGEHLGCERSHREQIAFMEPDDDIHYTLVGLGVIEKHGADFGWEQVARYWLGHIPWFHLCTAERQAALNFVNRSTGPASVATPEFTRSHRNPYREWIGAQIRSDGWAFCCAGNPELAAEFAWRDASWTHVRNGIYGEMFLAAMQAAAFVVDDPHELVRIGLSEIPARCRLASAVGALLAVLPELDDWESAMGWVEEHCAEISPGHVWDTGVPTQGMNPIHTINNALVCVIGMVYGDMDAVRGPAVAVMCGLDTDCNGASVGSIVGAAAGAAGMNQGLAAQLNDTIKPAMVGFAEVRMADLAARTARQWHRLRSPQVV